MNFSDMRSTALTVFVILVSILTSSCSVCDTDKLRDIPIPAAGSSPDRVVRAYLDALSARDIDTMRAISSANFFERQAGGPDAAICNLISLEKISIGTPHSDVYGPGGYRQVRTVLVSFVMEQHEEVSMENGWNAWGYILGRNSVHEPWLIIDAGVG
ncbi:hypothetical protein ABT061_26450 [Streptosporangium sp. NPDC002544]|uniref:hypothetical protein n=1 Tax=Streptosporangium sp. NPDC002544 TaxID=3154538 RepID=UPI003316C6A8